MKRVWQWGYLPPRMNLRGPLSKSNIEVFQRDFIFNASPGFRVGDLMPSARKDAIFYL